MPVQSGPPPVKAPSPAAAARTSRKTAERAEAVTGLGQLAQVPLMVMRQYADVGAVSAHWPGVAAEVAKLAETQEQVAKLVDPLLQVGPYAGLITAVLPLVMQLACNHGVVAAGSMGTVPPSTLAAQVEAQLAQQEAAALRLQLEAEREARKVREQIQADRDEYREMAETAA